MKTKKRNPRRAAKARSSRAGGSAPSLTTESYVTEFTYSPPADKQLEKMMSAMSDIIDLGKNIKDAECFRRHAMRIAQDNSTICMTCSLNVGDLPTKTWVGEAGAKLDESLLQREQNIRDEVTPEVAKAKQDRR